MQQPSSIDLREPVAVQRGLEVTLKTGDTVARRAINGAYCSDYVASATATAHIDAATRRSGGARDSL